MGAVQFTRREGVRQSTAQRSAGGTDGGRLFGVSISFSSPALQGQCDRPRSGDVIEELRVGVVSTNYELACLDSDSLSSYPCKLERVTNCR